MNGRSREYPSAAARQRCRMTTVARARDRPAATGKDIFRVAFDGFIVGLPRYGDQGARAGAPAVSRFWRRTNLDDCRTALFGNRGALGVGNRRRHESDYNPALQHGLFAHGTQPARSAPRLSRVTGRAFRSVAIQVRIAGYARHAHSARGADLPPQDGLADRRPGRWRIAAMGNPRI